MNNFMEMMSTSISLGNCLGSLTLLGTILGIFSYFHSKWAYEQGKRIGMLRKELESFKDELMKEEGIE